MSWQVANAKQVAAAEAHIGEPEPSVVVEDDPDSGATRVSVFTPDREGLFYRICAGLAAAGASIIDARIHTTRDGMALDNLLVLDGRGQPYADRRMRNRLVRSVEARAQRRGIAPLFRDPSLPRRSSAFDVAPSVAIADRASTRTTVVEVNARDRPALLAGLAWAIHECGHQIHSAHIATYGERAVDVFYLTRADGKKLDAGDSEYFDALLEPRAPRCEAAKKKAPPRPRPAYRLRQPRSGAVGGGGGGGGAGRRRLLDHRRRRRQRAEAHIPPEPGG